MVANQLNIEELLHQASQLYTRRVLGKALAIAKEALHLSKEEPFIEGMQAAHLLLGKINSTAGHYQGDAAAFEKALEHLQEAKELQAKEIGISLDLEITLTQGQVLRYQMAHEQAIQHFQEALASPRNKEIAAQVKLCCALSQVYISKNAFDKALESASKAKKLLIEKEDKAETLQIEVYHQLAHIFIRKRQQYAKILSYSEKVLAYSQREGDVEKELRALNNIAIVHGVQSDYKSAMQYFLEELDKSKAVRYHFNIAQCLINIGTI